MKTLIRNGTVLYEGKLQKKEVLFDETGILAVEDAIDAEAEVIDATGLHVLPGPDRARGFNQH